jgi:hypothetical protein
MHTAQSMRRRGAGSAMLRHIMATARKRQVAPESRDGLVGLLLTRASARSHGFVECPPFDAYVTDPNRIFMSLDLRDSMNVRSPGTETLPGSLPFRRVCRAYSAVRAPNGIGGAQRA